MCSGSFRPEGVPGDLVVHPNNARMQTPTGAHQSRESGQNESPVTPFGTERGHQARDSGQKKVASKASSGRQEVAVLAY